LLLGCWHCGSWYNVRCTVSDGGCGCGCGWYNARGCADDYGNSGGTTDKRGGMFGIGKVKLGYTITEILVA